MAWIKNINQVLTNDYDEQYRGLYIKRSYPVNDEKGNTIARAEHYTQMSWYSDEDKLRGIGSTWDRPDKQTMRMRWARKNTPRVKGRSDTHGVDIYSGVDKYIKKHIGRPFARTYSNFLFRSKYAHYRDSNIGFHGYDSARKVFISSFSAAHSDYCIDSDGLIQPTPSKSQPKNKDLKLYLPPGQRYEEYSINYQKVIQAEPILREYFSERRVNKLIELAGNWMQHPIYIGSILGWPDSDMGELLGWWEPGVENKILEKIKSFRSNRRRYIWDLNSWFVDRRLHYIDRIIKAGTREWYVEKCKLKREQKYSRKHRHEIDTEFYDAILIARKHGIDGCHARERIISHANFYKNKQKALRKKPTYFYKESVGCTGEILY